MAGHSRSQKRQTGIVKKREIALSVDLVLKGGQVFIGGDLVPADIGIAGEGRLQCAEHWNNDGSLPIR